ncbi:MAG: 6-bladed beta-propeller [Tannerellaceae bacterium]|jgi:hypothetical protein|nr:6-bladed beta-propeller [Tannerellaceae bacterium]
MKKSITMLATILYVMTGCEESKQSTDELITVDVTASYPKKELILQDFMDVEYVPLETTDEFITQGLLQDVGEEYIIVINRVDDGDIFIFDRSGKALRKINRLGQGGEEYSYISGIVLDENESEILVNDYFSKKIMVYDMEGNFKRNLPHKKDGSRYGEFHEFDREHLICYESYNDNYRTDSMQVGPTFMVVSKRDGSISGEIQIPFKEKKTTMVTLEKDETTGLIYTYAPSTNYRLVPNFHDWILIEISSDTLYLYSQDRTMKPFIARIPSIQTMTPEVFLFVSLFTDRYYFMEAVKKDLSAGFPGTDLLYDKQEKAIFRYTVYNDDYANEEKAFLKSWPVNNEIPTRQILEAHELVEAYEKGQLQGRLKEIAATLDEESNPVIMLIKHKKQ